MISYFSWFKELLIYFAWILVCVLNLLMMYGGRIGMKIGLQYQQGNVVCTRPVVDIMWVLTVDYFIADSWQTEFLWRSRKILILNIIFLFADLMVESAECYNIVELLIVL